MTARIDVNRQASIHVRCGASGSGKSWGVKEDIKKAKRLLIFDPDDEYNEQQIKGIHTVTRPMELLKLLARFPRGALKVRFLANGAKNFDLWSKAAFEWGNCTVVAEELRGVTTTTKAPIGWHTLVTRGRKKGITIYAVTQRPAECDKTVLGNATTLRTGRLSRDKDKKYLADEMSIDKTKIAFLQNLEYVEISLNTGAVHQGKMGTKMRRKIR
jgi:hypothetical protein